MSLPFIFLTDGWSLFFCSPSTSQTQRKVRANPLVMMWYGLLPLVPFTVCFLSSSNAMYICILCGVLPLTPFFFFLFLQVEVPPPMIDGALVKEVITAQSTTALGVEKEPPSGGVKLSNVLLLWLFRNLKLSSLLFPRIPILCRLPVLLKL